jgi:hypothetical protein
LPSLERALIALAATLAVIGHVQEFLPDQGKFVPAPWGDVFVYVNVGLTMADEPVPFWAVWLVVNRADDE